MRVAPAAEMHVDVEACNDPGNSFDKTTRCCTAPVNHQRALHRTCHPYLHHTSVGVDPNLGPSLDSVDKILCGLGNRWSPLEN